MLKVIEPGHCKDPEKEETEWVSNMGRYNLNRLLYSCLLSIPSFRYRIKIPKKEIPNIRDAGPFWPLSKATINAECSDHVEDLFDLGYRPKYFARLHKVPKRHSGQGPFEGGHWATPAALTATMKIRTTHLAVPRRWYARLTRKFYGHKLTEKQRKALDSYIDNATKTVYFIARKKKKAKPQARSRAEGFRFRWPKRKPKIKKPYVPDMERFTKLAVPRPIPPQPEIDRGRKMNVEDIDMTKLATPSKRLKIKKVDLNKVYEVKKGALEYTISDRVAEIAQPKPFFGEPPFNPYIISRGALQYEVSERVAKLATPRERKDPPSDLKEDPFVVPPIALKAMCTPRTAELAEPRVRK